MLKRKKEMYLCHVGLSKMSTEIFGPCWKALDVCSCPKRTMETFHLRFIIEYKHGTLFKLYRPFLSCNSWGIVGFTLILVFHSMFSRVTLKSMSNCSWVNIDLIIGFLLILSVNSFSDTDSILLVLSWAWWPHLSVTTKSLGDNLSMVLLFVFSHSKDLSVWTHVSVDTLDRTKSLRLFGMNQASLWTFWTGPNVPDQLSALWILTKLKSESSKLCLCMTQIEQLGAKWTFSPFLSSSISNYFWRNYQVHRCQLRIVNGII